MDAPETQGDYWELMRISETNGDHETHENHTHENSRVSGILLRNHENHRDNCGLMRLKRLLETQESQVD